MWRYQCGLVGALDPRSADGPSPLIGSYVARDGRRSFGLDGRDYAEIAQNRRQRDSTEFETSKHVGAGRDERNHAIDDPAQQDWVGLEQVLVEVLARTCKSGRLLSTAHRSGTFPVRCGARGLWRTRPVGGTSTQMLSCSARRRKRGGTAVWYSNAAVIPRAFVPLGAQIRAQRSLPGRYAPSSQRGGQGFESPQLHRYVRRSKALSRSGMRAFVIRVGLGEVPA